MRKSLSVTTILGIALVISSAVNASFYQQRGESSVWYMSGEEYCHVSSPAQLDHLGGTGKVEEVKLSDNIFAGREDKGVCSWTQGFYEIRGDSKIYMIKNGELCHVQSPDQLSRLGGQGDVKTIAAGADIESGLDNIGDCRWP